MTGAGSNEALILNKNEAIGRYQITPFSRSPIKNPLQVIYVLIGCFL